VKRDVRAKNGSLARFFSRRDQRTFALHDSVGWSYESSNDALAA
jgi:hypothetical protein